MYYKVLTPTLRSVGAHSLTKQYRIGCWNHANREAYKLGYGLLVFQELIYLKMFVATNENLLFSNGCAIFQCEVKRPMELPNRLIAPSMALIRCDGHTDRDWPQGTHMFGSVRLRHEVSI